MLYKLDVNKAVLKTPVSKIPSKSIISELELRPRQQYFLKFPRIFQHTVNENHRGRGKNMNLNFLFTTHQLCNWEHII